MDCEKSNEQAESDGVISKDESKRAMSPAESAETPVQAQQDGARLAQQPGEDDTLYDTLNRLIVSPRQTWRNVKQLLNSEHTITQASESVSSAAFKSPIAPRLHAVAKPQRTLRPAFKVEQVQLLVYLLAVICALIGTGALLGPEGIDRTPERTLNVGAPYLLLAFLVWLLGELVGQYRELRDCWMGLDTVSRARWIARIAPLAIGLTSLEALSSSMTAAPESSFGLLQVALARLLGGLIIWYLIELIVRRIRARTIEATSLTAEDSSDRMPGAPSRLPNLGSLFRLNVSRGRVILIVALAICSIIVWLNTGGNQIQPPYILLWFVSSILWGFVFVPADWSLLDWVSDRIDAWRRIRWSEHRSVIFASVLILILGVSFRFTDLHTVPPEMTSDHVEKVQDAYRVFSGDYKIFFPNNGGREPLQMYLLAALANLPGLDFNFFTLKFLSAVESILTLPVLLWMGMELIGEKRKRFNVSVALLLTGLVAASYWHVIIGRQGLRVPFTPLVTALLLVYLARAMRQNRRSDFVKAGLILGFGLYMYQAVRMLPVVIVVGVAVAMAVRRIGWHDRLRYLIHLSILVFVSLMVFLPMLHYAIEFPNQFWMRTTTRILGDDLAWATAQEAEEALRANVSVFMNNVRNALLMFNWKGDIGWFNGAPEYPMMDIITGAFLIVGAAAWMVRMLKSRDPVIWFIPLVILIMLMPTILSLAHPNANPSNSRALGAVPVVYLIAALPIAIIASKLLQCFSGRTGRVAALLLCAGIILLANHRNTETYFERYARAYIGPSFPHSEAGSMLRGFINSDGAPGNAFSIGFPFWWDYRALGIVAGYPLWPNDGAPIEWLPRKLKDARRRTDELRLDPDRDLLFFYNIRDEDTQARLSEWFPNGREMLIQSYHPEDKFMLYRVPALGEAGWNEFFPES